MHKLTLIFHRQDDTELFESRWSHEFVPQAEEMPGIRKVTVSRVLGGTSPDVDIVLLHEFHFDDRDALEAAMDSPEGQVAGRTLIDIAGDQVEILISEHHEDDSS